MLFSVMLTTVKTLNSWLLRMLLLKYISIYLWSISPFNFTATFEVKLLLHAGSLEPEQGSRKLNPNTVLSSLLFIVFYLCKLIISNFKVMISYRKFRTHISLIMLTPIERERVEPLFVSYKNLSIATHQT